MRLILGRSGFGKTTKCLNEIKECIESGFDKPIIYIVPEQFSFESEKNLIKTCGKNGIIGTQVLSFKRLAYRILAENNISINSLSDSGKAMLIYYLLLKNESKLQVLKGVSKNIGLVNTVSDEISEFKRYNITPDLLANIDFKNDYLNMKIHDLLIIYEEYETRIIDIFVDSNDILTILAEAIKDTKSLNGAKIWIDEFDGFIPQEYTIINELNKKCDITISIISSDGELFDLNNQSVDRLIKNDSNVSKEYLTNSYRFNNDELKFIEDNIFRIPFNIYDNKNSNIRINNYKNSYEEIENIAKQILLFVRSNEDIRFENIAILTRDVDKYKNTIKSTFSKYDIPYFIDDKKELSIEPLMLLTLSFIDIISNNYKYESIFTYLKTCLTNITDENDIDLIENYILKWGIKGKKWEEPFIIEDINLEKINIIRENIIAPIIEFKDKFSGRKTTKEIIAALYEFLNKINVFETIEDKVDSFKTNNNIRLALEYSQVWNVLIEIFDDMASSIGDEQISFDKFQSILKIGISSHEISVIPATKDKVIIGDIERTRNSEIKVLFIIGMNDGSFPISIQNEGFINDNERQIMLNNGIEIAKDTKKLLSQDYFNIYKALCVPSDYLFLSYPLADLEGKALRSSFIINQIKSMFPKLIVNEYKEDSNLIISKTATFERIIDDIRKRKDDESFADRYFYVRKWYEENLKDKYNTSLKGLDYKNTVEYQSKDISKKLYGESMNSSVSKLESYMLCPYSFYLRYGLKLKERDIYKLQTPDIGSFLHEIIEIFTKKVLEDNIDIRSISKEECNCIVDDITGNVLFNFRQNLFSSTGKLRSLSIKLKEQVKKTIWLIVYHIKSGSFNIMGSEVEFGKNKEFKEMNIELDDGNKLILSGKIDRIDIAQIDNNSYIRIVDYKSSNKAIKLSNVYYGVQLQLLAYSDVISKDLFKPGGVFYLKLDDPFLKTDKRISKEDVENRIMDSLKMNGLAIANVKLFEASDSNFGRIEDGDSYDSNILNLKIDKNGKYSKMPVVTENDFDNLRKHMHKLLKEIGNEIMKGNVKNEPLLRKGSTSPCDYCDFKKACRFDKTLGNKSRRLNELKDEEVIEKIKE